MNYRAVKNLNETILLLFYVLVKFRTVSMFSLIQTGVAPVTDFLKGSGLNISDRGFVVVDKV